MVVFPPVPQEIKPIAHLLKLAEEHETRNIVVTYWARMAACLMAFKIVPGKKPPDVAAMIGALLDWLEQCRKDNTENEGITNETAAHAIIEEYALRLFEFGDQQDKAEVFNKNTVKTFYTAGVLMDVLDQFGPIGEDIREKRKYAKWKAAYIHNCLKAGQTPTPGPPRDPDENTTGIVRNSDLPADELATFKKYDGPIDFDNLVHKKPEPPTNPVLPPEDFIGLLPNPEDVHSHAPAPSPITPLIPPNPSPFTNPNNNTSPSTPQIYSNPTPFSTPNVIVPAQPSPSVVQPPSPMPARVDTGFQPSPEQIQKAQKFCKFATSALNYDDVKTALDNLYKAVNLLQTGSE